MSAAVGWVDLNVAAAWVLGWVWQALVYGTLLAGLTWVVTRVVRAWAAAALHTALWIIVLIKFLVPVGPSWSHSMASVFAEIPAAAPAIVGGTPQGVMEGVGPTFHLAQASVDGSSVVGAGRERWHWTVFVAGAYALAVFVLLVGKMRGYRAFYVKCRALPGADAGTRRLVGDVCRRLGVRRVPRTYVSDAPPAPFVVGVFRPLLVLSRRHLVRPDELETVVVHEVAHLRRGDLFVRVLQQIAGTLLFFWPVVGWVNRRIEVAREQACDEWALRHGRLSAGAYARCVLHAARAWRPARAGYHPVCMATNPATIERRIDVILDTSSRVASPPVWGLPKSLFLLFWAGFVLAGAVEADNQAWPVTEEGVKEHAVALYARVAAVDGADVDGDGVVTYVEKDAYLVALAMRSGEAFMEEFPWADRNHSDRLDYLEAYGVIRGITRIAYLDRRIGAEMADVTERESDAGRARIAEIKVRYAPEELALLHEALDAQAWLLEHVTAEPAADELENVQSVLKRVQGSPQSYSRRMLDHGGPGDPSRGKRGPSDAGRFQELEGNISQVKAKLAVERDPRKAARLEAMLDKLEAILAGLEG